MTTLLAPVLWLLWLALWLVLFIIGLPACALALACGAVTPDHDRDTAHWSWRWMWVFDNDEDGIAPHWYLVEHANRSITVNRFIWSALRNNVNNMARIPGLNCKLDTARFRFIEGPNFFICWQGPYAGGAFEIGQGDSFKSFGFGYGFGPWDQHGRPADDTRDVPYFAQHWHTYVLLALAALIGSAWLAI